MRKYQPLTVFGVIVFIGTILFAAPVQAVTISQLNLEIVARPGETIEQLIYIYDESFTGATVYPVVYNFTASPGKEGSVLILSDPVDLKPDHAWVKWSPTQILSENADEETVKDISTDEEQTVPDDLGQEDIPIKLPVDGTLADFPYWIEIPQDAEPGAHLISLVFQLKPTEQTTKEGTAIYVGSNIATNIFLKVLGATIDDIEVDFKSGFFTNRDPKVTPTEREKSFQQKSFFLKPPVDFLLTVNNKGNTYQKPDGNVKIVNDLLGSSPEKLLVNEENKIILPGTERVFDVPSFGQGFMFGKYRAKITLLYGDPLRPVEKEISFWVVPLVEILIVLAVLILIIIITIIIRKIRKKGRQRREAEREEKMRRKIIDEINNKKLAPRQKDKEQKAQKSRKKQKKANNKLEKR